MPHETGNDFRKFRSGRRPRERCAGVPVGRLRPGSVAAGATQASRLGGGISRPYRSMRRSRSAFAMTDTELRLIAALAIIGDSRMPNTGYSRPAATGTPSAL